MTIATQQKVSIPIRNALAELPEAQARVFRLRAIEKHSFQEIGQEVGVFWEQAVSIYIAAVYNAKTKDIDIEALAKVASPNRVLEKDDPEQFLKELEHSQKPDPDPSKKLSKKLHNLAQLNQELESEIMATENNKQTRSERMKVIKGNARKDQKSKQGSQPNSGNSLGELGRKIKAREAELKTQLEAIQSELAILGQDKEVIEKAIAVQIKYQQNAA